MKKVATILPDGSPEWLPQVERWLVGGALLSRTEDIVNAAAVCSPDDFRDELLGKAWASLPYMECPCVAHLVRELGDEYAPEFVELAGAQGAWLYATKVGLEAHASLVHEWGEKRRKIRDLSEQAKAVYAGASNVVPITRATGVRPFIAS